MASLLFSRLVQNTAQRCTPQKLLPVIHNFSCSQQRQMTHYPIDDIISGLTEEQVQLRKTVFDFVQKELAPKANDIDKLNTFTDMREFYKKCGALGLLGITAKSEYGGSDDFSILFFF